MITSEPIFSQLKVLELASVLAGPGVGQFFAELGAEVIKVENIRTRGDVTRSWKTAGENTDDRSAYFCSVNWGKKSIAIDLNHPEGRKIIHQLIPKIDVVIASFKPGDAVKLGVDHKVLTKINPRIIYGQITGYGSKNQRVGYDAVIQAEAGFMFMNGEPGRPSLKMPVALIDILAAHHLKEAILLSLLKRERTGTGDFVEVSLIQAAVSSLVNQATNWLVAGKLPGKLGSSHPNISPYGDVFATADGRELLLAVGDNRQFKSLCELLGIPELASDPDYINNEWRVFNRTSLNGKLSARIKTFKADEIHRLLAESRIPAGLVKNIEEVFQIPEIQDSVIHSSGLSGVLSYIGSNRGSNISSHFPPPPHYGEHSKEILIDLLGFTPHAVENLIHSGVVA